MAVGRRTWPADLSGRLGRQTWPADLSGRLGRQSCPADLAGRLGRQTWPADLAGRLGRQTWLADLTQTFSIFELQSSQCVLALRLLANILAQSDSAVDKGEGIYHDVSFGLGGGGDVKKLTKNRTNNSKNCSMHWRPFFCETTIIAGLFGFSKNQRIAAFPVESFDFERITFKS
jgi:hypothetical protein